MNEQTILQKYSGRMPHCTTFSDNTECAFNPHTNECRQYKGLLSGFPKHVLELEGLYREWRKEYLSGPSKPSFRYPSSRTLPVPKIFGRGFFEVDFVHSVLRLRLDDMPDGEFQSFGFKPWPNDYDVQPDTTEITSVHIHFVGTRARVGFRFRIPHRQCRFQISQDEIDELRSREYPRQAQDQDFLDEAGKRILEGFEGDPAKELRILTVDLGTSGGYTALFKGTQFEKGVPLKVIKLDKLYDQLPRGNREKGARGKKDESGINHVGRHLDGIAKGAAEIAKKRPGTDVSILRPHDMRRLTTHIRWMIRDWVRLNASQITKIAESNEVDLIVFESLRGFKAPGYDKLDQEKKRRLGFFAYGSIRRKVAEKAVERGMRVITVPYLYSSQVCSKCRKKQQDTKRWSKNKRNRQFDCECERCNFKANSDENAARVLGRVFWGEIQLPEKRSEKST